MTLIKYFKRRHLVVAGLALAALLVGGYVGWQQSRPPPATLAQIQLPDIQKNIRRGDEWLGKVVVVNHWATWCPPCREEIPLLIEYQRRFGTRGVQVVGIAHDTLDDVRAYGDGIGINYPSLLAVTGGGELMRRQGNQPGGLPFTAFFNRAGNLASAQLGQLTEAELHRAVAPLL